MGLIMLWASHLPLNLVSFFISLIKAAFLHPGSSLLSFIYLFLVYDDLTAKKGTWLLLFWLSHLARRFFFLDVQNRKMCAMAKTAQKPQKHKEICRNCKHAERRNTTLEFYRCPFFTFSNMPTFSCDEWEAE